MRTLVMTLIGASFLATPAFANSSKKSDELQLPSQEQMEAIVKKLPNINGMMDSLVALNEDGKLEKRMEKSGKAFTRRLEKSGALESRENGMPDFNKMMAVMLLSLSDEEVMGGLVETIDDLQAVMEETTKDIDTKGLVED